LSKGKVTAALICCFAVAMTAAGWAAYSYAVPSIPLLLPSAAYERTSARQPQTSNTDAKGDRLLAAAEVLPDRYSAATLEPPPPPAAYALAAVGSTAIEPAKPRIEPRIELRKPLAAEKSADKPKRAAEKLLLDDAQIAALRARLKLTPTQEEFWPAIEVTLRNVVQQHARRLRKADPRHGTPQIDVNSPEVQKLITAATPLIMRLSEEQKREVRQLARIIGLETVAARI
jgi:hypothetical protein